MDPLTAAPVPPVPAERLIPHRPPMRLVETLLACEEDSGVTESRPAAGSLFADAAGALDGAALVELIAQSSAAVRGFRDLVNGRAPGVGLLVGIRDLRITGRAFAGDRLRTTVRMVAAFDGFAVVFGVVTRGGDAIASGTLTLRLVDG